MRHRFRFRFNLLTLLFAMLTSMGATAAFAQTPVTPTPTTKLAWDADGFQTEGFNVYDGIVQIKTAAPTVAGMTYSVPFPALTPGRHTLGVAAFNQVGESGRAVLTVDVIVRPPSDPFNVRIASLLRFGNDDFDVRIRRGLNPSRGRPVEFDPGALGGNIRQDL